MVLFSNLFICFPIHIEIERGLPLIAISRDGESGGECCPSPLPEDRAIWGDGCHP